MFTFCTINMKWTFIVLVISSQTVFDIEGNSGQKIDIVKNVYCL